MYLLWEWFVGLMYLLWEWFVGLMYLRVVCWVNVSIVRVVCWVNVSIVRVVCWVNVSIVRVVCWVNIWESWYRLIIFRRWSRARGEVCCDWLRWLFLFVTSCESILVPPCKCAEHVVLAFYVTFLALFGEYLEKCEEQPWLGDESDEWWSRFVTVDADVSNDRVCRIKCYKNN